MATITINAELWDAMTKENEELQDLIRELQMQVFMLKDSLKQERVKNQKLSDPDYVHEDEMSEEL